MALLRRLASIALLLLSRTGPAQATPNLLGNPDFDDSDAPWSISFDPGGSAGFASGDTDGCLLSGSVLFDVTGTGASALLEQCVALPPAQPPTRARVRLIKEGTNAWAQLSLTFYADGAPCQGPFISLVSGPVGGAGNAWTTMQTPAATVPASAKYALLRLDLGETGTSFGIRVDRAYVGDGTEIFSEDFDAGEACPFVTVVEE